MGHAYRLVLQDDGRNCEQTVEFDAAGAESALVNAQRYCGGRYAELFEDGRSLGRLHLDPGAGFWTVSAPDGARRGG